MSLGNKGVMRTTFLSNTSKVDMFHHFLVHLHQEPNVCIIVKIRRTSDLDMHILKVLWRESVAKTPTCSMYYKSHTRFVVMT